MKLAAGEISEVLEADTLIAGHIRDHLHTLLHEIATGDLYDLQERYVLLFDRTRSLSLHLFEHVHGESRDRGQAMIDLKSQYEQAGLFMNASELPDFLPMFLEYLATRAPKEAYEALGQPVHIFGALAERLRKRKSPYEAVFRVLIALAAAKPKDEDVSALLQRRTRMRPTWLRLTPPGRTNRSISDRAPATAVRMALSPVSAAPCVRRPASQARQNPLRASEDIPCAS